MFKAILSFLASRARPEPREQDGPLGEELIDVVLHDPILLDDAELVQAWTPEQVAALRGWKYSGPRQVSESRHPVVVADPVREAEGEADGVAEVVATMARLPVAAKE